MIRTTDTQPATVRPLAAHLRAAHAACVQRKPIGGVPGARTPAPHVEAAQAAHARPLGLSAPIARPAGAPDSRSLQPRTAVAPPAPVPHVQAALARLHPAAVQRRAASVSAFLPAGRVVQRAELSDSEESGEDEKEEEEPIWEKVKREKMEKLKESKKKDEEEEEIPQSFQLQLQLSQLTEDMGKGELNKGYRVQFVQLIRELNKIHEADSKAIASKVDEIIRLVLHVQQKAKDSYRWLCRNKFVALLKKFNDYDCHNKFSVDAIYIFGENLK